jgi:predicted nicotinamide N-methyase
VPELLLHLLAPSSPAWRWTEPEALGWPYWAFAWAGGQVLGRYLLDHPERVRGRRVLSFGAGGGVDAIAAARAGAAVVIAADVDPLAGELAQRNAGLNNVGLQYTTEDFLGRPIDAEVLLLGDACYNEALGARVLPWIEALSRDGVLVLLGDPGRVELVQRLRRVATYLAPADGEPDGALRWATSVFEG